MTTLSLRLAQFILCQAFEKKLILDPTYRRLENGRL